MSNQPRVARVLAVLLVSMTVGAVVLMALGGNPPSAGPFCLASYYNLGPIEEAILSRAAQSPGRWSRIEIRNSRSRGGNIEQLASLSGLSSPEDINCHFVICNGLGGGDGQIQTTAKWQKQWAVIPAQNGRATDQVIRICVIADGETTQPTSFQIKRTEALVESLSRKFGIGPKSIRYPANWQ